MIFLYHYPCFTISAKWSYCDNFTISFYRGVLCSTPFQRPSNYFSQKFYMASQYTNIFNFYELIIYSLLRLSEQTVAQEMSLLQLSSCLTDEIYKSTHTSHLALSQWISEKNTRKNSEYSHLSLSGLSTDFRTSKLGFASCILQYLMKF